MQTVPVTVVGSYLSPYVRKVLVSLEFKSVPYQIDPIVPFYGNEEFERISPLRRVPVLIDDNGALADSTVICEYLDERYPSPGLYPQDVAQKAQARWLEEFADSRLGQVFVWNLYNQTVIRKYVWGKAPDEAVLQHALNVEVPQVLNYLENIIPHSGYLFGTLSIADIAIVSFFKNAFFGGLQLDAGRWPKVAAFVARILELECFSKLVRWEKVCLKTPPDKHHVALRDAGAPVVASSMGVDRPQPNHVG